MNLIRILVLLASLETLSAADSRPLEVLFFVMTDCPVSNAFAPEIQRVCDHYRERGVRCRLVYEDLRAVDFARHNQEYGYGGMPFVFDENRSIARLAGATVTPQAVVLDPTGTVRYRGRINNLYASVGRTRRQITEHDLRDALDALLAGLTVPVPETKALGCYIADPSVLRP